MTAIDIKFSEEEADMLVRAIAALAESTRTHNQHEAADMLVEIGTRIEHATIAGQGMSPESKELFNRELIEAMDSGDAARLNLVFGRYLTTLGRVDPDPPKTLALIIINDALPKMQLAAATAGANTVLGMAIKKLDVFYADCEGQEGQDFVEYIREWVRAGVADIQAGRDPWSEDGDLKD